MFDVNKVTLIGHITQDLVQRTGSKLLCTGSVATNRRYKKSDGTIVDDVEYHNFVAFEKVAEAMITNCQKGTRVFIDGEIRTSSWNDETGQKRSRTQIIVHSYYVIAPNQKIKEQFEHAHAVKNAPKQAEPQYEDVPW